MNIADLVDSNSRKLAGRDFLRINGKGYTYSEIRHLSEKTAGLFQEWGLHKGDRVAIMSHNTLGFVLSFLGAIKAGAVVVPINHKLVAPEVDYILGHSGASLFLFDGALAPVATALSSPIRKISLDSSAEGWPQLELLLDSAPPFKFVAIDEEDPAEILYTSGTTGKPKGCVHTHRTVIMAGIAICIAIKFDESDRILMAMPIWHSSPLNNWFIGILYAGGTVVMIREYHPLHFLQAIQNEKCTAYFGAPISFIMPVQMIPNFKDYDLTSMRVFMYGGGPIAGDTALMLMEKYKSDHFYQCYGMTEAGPTGTVLFPKDQVRKAGSIGRQGLPGCDVKVMKTDAVEAGPGEIGEIWLKAGSMMKGYYNDPAATADAFSGSWYKTGDVARVDAEGYLFMADRIKDMIVTGGENVYSKEVEDALAAYPGIVEAAVIGVPHPEWGETVSAIIVADKAEMPQVDAMTAFLSSRLARFKIPRHFEFVDALPHTPSGKIMKYKLRETYSRGK